VTPEIPVITPVFTDLFIYVSPAAGLFTPGEVEIYDFWGAAFADTKRER